ncbi:hypothetical protein [Tenuibacillus multivorans]|uniref:hypothetical protein n=1 Tax=Tenuibacillus multivorans TaxID=237069 RepID=UPI000B19C4A2|nr:hypothetical protein [Tenuibacillus multivorans]GEL77999.1 hypothetical protein TMU01_22340 [Tenuibacillus multivorans]
MIQSFVCYSHPTEQDVYNKEGYIDLPWLNEILDNQDCEFYFCGTEGFMRNLKQALIAWKVPEQQIHYEFFGPSIEL